MTIPKELLRSAPRQAQLSAAGKLSVVAVFLLALGGLTGAAFLHVKAGRDQEHAVRRAAGSTTATGTITSVELRKGKKPRWHSTYTFDAGGRTVEGKLSTRKPVEVGAPVKVAYLPSDPADNWIVGQEPQGGQFLLGPLVGIVSLCLAGLVIWRLKRQLYLACQGRPALATVTASRKVHHQHGHIYRVSYQFPLLNGALRRGSMDLRKALEPGTEFVVVYDPDQPKHAGRYPFSLAKLPKP